MNMRKNKISNFNRNTPKKRAYILHLIRDELRRNQPQNPSLNKTVRDALIPDCLSLPFIVSCCIFFLITFFNVIHKILKERKIFKCYESKIYNYYILFLRKYIFSGAEWSMTKWGTFFVWDAFRHLRCVMLTLLRLHMRWKGVGDILKFNSFLYMFWPYSLDDYI